MFNTLIKTFIENIAKDKLYANVKQIASFHRIQASTGYREAANYCVDYLNKNDVHSHLLSYPTNQQEYVSTYKTFQEWKCEDAYLDIVYPIHKRIADYKDNPITVIQKSIPCDYRNQKIDIVEMDNGNNPEYYEGIDFSNKIVFIHDDFHQYLWVLEKGAIGFISDFIREVKDVRTREDMYDSINYTSFWWKDNKEERKAFGYVLSPRQGDYLKALCREVKEKHKENSLNPSYVQVSCFMDSALYDGFVDVVEATIQGKEEDSILIIAHLCHPYQSANDNASGCSGAMELMCTIQKLIKENKIEKPQKTIKMILVPEFTGTFFYLNDGRDLTKIKYGINLDMIGAKQEETTGPINITNLPYSTPSFVDSLARFLAKQIQVLSKDTNEKLESVIYKDIPFGIGSDHFILCDPMLNIPCIMLGQWPDKHYHTSSDTIDRIDPIVLKFSTVLATSYVYTLANFKDAYKPFIMEEMVLHFSETALQQYKNKKSITSLYDFFKKSAQSLQYETIDFSQLATKFDKYKSSFSNHNEIPTRNFNMPIVDIIDLIIEDKEKIQVYEKYVKTHPAMQIEYALPQVLCDYYTDGKRSISQIANYIACSFDVSEKDIYDYFMMMHDIQLMQIK